jgi:hypothetical protein
MRTLADRYSLEDCVLDGPHWSYWRGYDGVLRRPVGILVLAPDHPLESEVMAAARASAGAEDPRVLRVLDVLTDDQGTCFVIEWLTADSLEDLLREGPLDERDACLTVLEVARALAAVAPQGLAHGALAPHWVLRGDDGRVRLLGLSIAGALAGPTAPEAGPVSGTAAASQDASGLGALLYAALTGRWPGDPVDCALPPAPRQSGHPVRPRMVLAGVPSDLDDIASRALGLPGRSDRLVTPAAVAEALEVAATRLRGDEGGGPAASDLPGLLAGLTAVTSRSEQPRTRRRSVPTAAALVVIALLAVPSYLGIRSLSSTQQTPLGHATLTASPTPTTTAPPAGASIPILSVRDFDPPPGNGSENPDLVKYATDGNVATAWMTVPYYGRPDLGGLKTGVGLLLDLGQVTEVGAVSVNLVGYGTSLELRSSTTLQPQADDYTPIAKADNAGTFVTLRPVAATKARFLLIWLTSLPADGSRYRGGIAEIHVYRD